MQEVRKRRDGKRGNENQIKDMVPFVRKHGDKILVACSLLFMAVSSVCIFLSSFFLNLIPYPVCHSFQRRKFAKEIQRLAYMSLIRL